MSEAANQRFGSTSLFLAWRFFAGRDGLGKNLRTANRSANPLISFISAVSVVGLSLAIALLILVLSVMNGFEKEFRERILGLAPHATLWFDSSSFTDSGPDSISSDGIEPDQLAAKDWQTIIALLETQPDIVRAQAMIELKAMAVVANQVRPMLVQGVDYPRFESLIKPYLASLADPTSDGKTNEATTGLNAGEIIVGAHLAKALGLKLGSHLRLMVPDNSQSQISSLSRAASGAKTYAFSVKDILATGTELDNGIGLLTLSDAAKITSMGSNVHGIQIQVTDLFQARKIATQLAINYQLPVYITDWTQSFGNLYTAIQLSKQMVVLLLTTIIAVAVFNVFVTLGMVVRHKQTEIAILRTLGLTRNGVLISFIIQGMLISLLGCLIGVVLGCLLALGAPSMVNGLEAILGFEFLQTDVYPINYLPSEIKPADIVTVCTLALLMSLCATLYPAWRAANNLPATALRYL